MSQSPSIGRLRGRSREVELLRRRVISTRAGRSSFLWLEGEAGVGKTTLVDEVIWNDPDLRKLRVTAFQGEADLPFTALATLAVQLQPWEDHLSGHARRSLDDLISGVPLDADPFGPGAIVMSLLAAAAQERPVALFVDDAHWADPSSAGCMAFAFRRLDADAVLFIAAARPGSNSPLRPTDDRDILSVGPLLRGEARSVLDDYGEWSEQAASHVMASTGGNPLALRYLAERLSADQRRGLSELPAVDGSEPLQTFADLAGFDAVDPPVRLALAALAAIGSDSRVVNQVLRDLGVDQEALVRAADIGLVRRASGGFEFVHPLLREAAMAPTGSSIAVNVHRAIAAASRSPDRRAHHLAATTRGQSAEIATVLATQGVTDLRDRGPVAAASALLHAARLTPPGSRRTERMLTAASALVASGRSAEALDCIDAVLSAPDASPTDLADALIVRAQVAMWAFESPEQVALEAKALADRVDDHRARLLLGSAVFCLMSLGHVSEARRLSSHRVFNTALADSEQAPFPLYVKVLGGEIEAIREVRSRAASMIDLLRQRNPSSIAGGWLYWSEMAQALNWAGSPEASLELSALLSNYLQDALAPALSASPLAIQSGPGWWLGQWDIVLSSAEEASRLAGDTGQPLLASYSQAVALLVAAARGDRAVVEQQSASIMREAEQFGAVALQLYAKHPVGLLALGEEQWIEASNHLESVESTARKIGYDCPMAVPYRPDLIEALIRGGRRDRAFTLLDEFSVQAERCDSDWARSCVLRLLGLLEPEGSADSRFEEALALWGRSGFDRARTELAWAEHRASIGDRAAANQLSGSALNTFRVLDARPWAARALKVSDRGEVVDAARSSISQLTSRETQVMLRVAEGLTDKQIATKLFLSEKTVEHHLASVYRKLNVSSRSQLTRLVLTESMIPPPVR